MGPFGNGLESAMLLQAQRCRNNSGGSFSSTTSSGDMPQSPVLPPTPTSTNDLNTLAMLLSMKENLNMQDVQNKSLGSSRYKTEMCRSFMETGQCKYGDKCQFAHGNHEQRALPRHPKYKTEFCRTFHTTGLCPYGTRCHFIHNEDPCKLDAIMRAKQQFIAQQAAQEFAKQAAQLRVQQTMIAGQINAFVSQMQNLAVLQQQTAVVPNALALYQLQQLLAAQQSRIVPTVSTPTASVYRDSLGSVVDTPPVSPPCGSPVFDESTVSACSPKSYASFVSPPPGFAPLRSNGCEKASSARNAFDFSHAATSGSFASAFRHINGSEAHTADTEDVVSQVLLDLQSLDLDSSMNSGCSSSGVSCDGSYSPPSSPDSFSHLPVDSARTSRLPIFRGIVSDM